MKENVLIGFSVRKSRKRAQNSIFCARLSEKFKSFSRKFYKFWQKVRQVFNFWGTGSPVLPDQLACLDD